MVPLSSRRTSRNPFAFSAPVSSSWPNMVIPDGIVAADCHRRRPGVRNWALVNSAIRPPGTSTRAISAMAECGLAIRFRPAKQHAASNTWSRNGSSSAPART